MPTSDKKIYIEETEVKLGTVAAICAVVSTIFSPILGYLLGTWDIPLFEELILIGTNGGVANIIGGGGPISALNIGKIILYIVGPRILMVGSCAILLRYIISLSSASFKEVHRVSWTYAMMIR